MMDLDIGVVSEVEKKQKKKLLLDYLYDNLKNHNWWAYRYFFCELLAFLNIVGKFHLYYYVDVRNLLHDMQEGGWFYITTSYRFYLLNVA